MPLLVLISTARQRRLPSLRSSAARRNGDDEEPAAALAARRKKGVHMAGNARVAPPSSRSQAELVELTVECRYSSSSPPLDERRSPLAQELGRRRNGDDEEPVAASAARRKKGVHMAGYLHGRRCPQMTG
ncbi:hypothetical protein Dimus_026412 [Dionaea muscipula]